MGIPLYLDKVPRILGGELPKTFQDTKEEKEACLSLIIVTTALPQIPQSYSTRYPKISILGMATLTQRGRN